MSVKGRISQNLGDLQGLSALDKSGRRKIGAAGHSTTTQTRTSGTERVREREPSVRRKSSSSPTGKRPSLTSPTGPRVSASAIHQLEDKFTERDLGRANHMLEIMASHDNRHDALNKHSRTSISEARAATDASSNSPPSLRYAPHVAAELYGIGDGATAAAGNTNGLSVEDREFWATAIRHADDQVASSEDVARFHISHRDYGDATREELVREVKWLKALFGQVHLCFCLSFFNLKRLFSSSLCMFLTAG